MTNTFKPGDRVRFRDIPAVLDTNRGKVGTVVDPELRPGTKASLLVLLKMDDESFVGWVDDGYYSTNPDKLELVPNVGLFPVGATVRVTSPSVLDGLVGTVLKAGNRSDVVVVAAPGRLSGRVDGGWLVNVNDLERVHLLTHDELETLDAVRRMSAPGDLGFDILNKHLRPTVTRTFTVTVEQPAGDEPVTVATLGTVLKSDDSLAYEAKIEEN